jgi:serine/threonine protein kinase
VSLPLRLIRSSHHRNRHCSALSTMNWSWAKTGKPVELGRGEMGVTYKAFDVDLQCPVTLKVISERYLGDESARLRFFAKRARPQGCGIQTLPRYCTWAETGSSYFSAMEFVEGETLENLIKRLGRLEVKLALEIATQIAAGLAAVHKQKLVHRDIKPSNIMVGVEDGGTVTAKIIDLGWPSPRPTRLLKLRFQLPELLLGPRSSPVPNSSLESRLTSARTCTRWV